VAVVGIFIISGAATKFPMTTLPGRAMRDANGLAKSPAALLITLLFVGGAAALISAFPAHIDPAEVVEVAPQQYPPLTDQQRADFEKWWDVQPKVEVPVDREGAKVLVVKFNDYQCPPCRQSHMDYKAVIAKYAASHPGQVRLVLRDFPLDSECNDTVTQSIHPGACEAAAAARLAREHNRLEAWEEWIFANQRSTPDEVKRAARDIGQVQDFDARYASVLEQTKADIAYGRTLGVRSTPTFFINGVKVEGALPPVYFDQAIAYELARAGGK
jgi:protein-disulfide isomerase